MITNLFSIFDPSTSIFNLSINWTASLIGLLIFPYIFWILPNRINIMWKLISINLHNEFKILIGNTSPLGRTFIFISIFLSIIINNVIGLFPYIFTRTSHLTFSLTLSLPLWIRFIIFGWINNTNHMFSHLIPQRTPPALIPFIALIETIRNLIRPGTLAVRLTANIIAGHLLLTLLGNTGNLLPTFIIWSLIIFQIALITLESAVALIQSYVFSILSTLYSREIN